MFKRITGHDWTKAELLQYIKELEDRLEVSIDHPYDGIECRDETIKMMQASIRDLKGIIRDYEEDYGRSYDPACWL